MTLSVSLCTILLVIITWKSYIRLKDRLESVRRRRRAIEAIQNDTFIYQYLAYISFSDTDDDEVLNHLSPVLNQTMRDTIGSFKFDLCLGELKFRLGFRRFAELERCIRNSAVVLAVISHNYCHNEFCIDELTEAFELKKPILFVLVKDIPEHQLPAVVKRLLKTNTISKMELVDGQPQFVPSLEMFCISLLGMVE